ncbi:MAG: 23S rRNA (adenine(2030)-N(6))-methyltransferase RlmJ [Xanthobacteraceae bacterium]|nr:MAG: 23S rRNA (adenine(2030)-N(6))-methyltransferase RlmJ [Xanthobacteraceae bacterium]
MNYRHAFHAGNFADVVKHAVLARVLTYLHDKPTPFRVIDTHAGAGLYDLAGEEARRGGEWQGGIGRLLADAAPGATAVSPIRIGAEADALLAPYLDIVRAYNGGALTAYPGSPLIARALLRPQDRLVACEVEAGARDALIESLRRDPQGRVVDLDGWTALAAFVPPRERRGVVLIDPPYEQRDEFERLAEGFTAAFRKWPTGIYLIWYPLKDPAAAERLRRRIAALAAKTLCVELSVAAPDAPGLGAAGLMVVNPPWQLARELGIVMPALAGRLGRDGAGAFRLGPLPPASRTR